MSLIRKYGSKALEEAAERALRGIPLNNGKKVVQKAVTKPSDAVTTSATATAKSLTRDGKVPVQAGGMTIYLPKGHPALQKPSVKRAVQATPRPMNRTQIEIIRLQIEAKQARLEQLQQLVKYDEKGALLSSHQECLEVLPKLDQQYVKRAKEALEVQSNRQKKLFLEFWKKSPVNSTITPSAPSWKANPDNPVAIVNKYKRLLETDCSNLQRELEKQPGAPRFSI